MITVVYGRYRSKFKVKDNKVVVEGGRAKVKLDASKRPRRLRLCSTLSSGSNNISCRDIACALGVSAPL